MPERPLGGYAPFEHITRVQAVRDFVDWLYDRGPDPTDMPREKLLERYWNAVATEALQSAANESPRLDDATINRVLLFPSRSTPEPI